MIAGLASLFGSVLWWAAGGRQTPGEHLDTIAYLKGSRAAIPPPPRALRPPATPPKTLTVMTWNIAYARGTNPDNDANDVRPRAVIEGRLAEMGALARARGVDVWLIQEIDFGARRSRDIDELSALAKASGLPFMARALSWRARWVPHPLWPPQKQYGKMRSGGAVLSRYPIVDNRVLLYEKPKENGAIYNAFYLFRYSQFVTLALGGGRKLVVVNDHLEAFNKKNRVDQARLLVKRVKTWPKPRPLMLLGGDLNTTPPEATKKSGFSDSPEDDYRDDETVAALRAMPGFAELVTAEEYAKNERAFFTFPTTARTRRLDYIFYDTRMKLRRREFLRPGKFSDHCPVLAVFETTPSTTPSTAKGSSSGRQP
ncbi:MAG: endonuclease/exonuclease/phosphatase family protein [Deltaproteobacteria bacterium]|nr:endonuclease/exonuclease/phosphatase family protein [Deltaproteobacteria bacterium]